MVKKLQKKILKKEEDAKKQGVTGKRKQKEEEEEDIWGNDSKEEEVLSSQQKKFKNFTKNNVIKVKSVVLPSGGQSYNPSARDHKKVLEKVVQEEEKDLEKVRRRKFPHQYNPEEQNAAEKKEKTFLTMNLAKEGEEESDEEVDEKINPAVKREDKLTRTERNKKLEKKLRREEEQKVKDKKNFDKQFHQISKYQKEIHEVAQERQKVIDAKKEAKSKELKQWEETGVVSKPSIIGRYKYKMRKTDF